MSARIISSDYPSDAKLVDTGQFLFVEFRDPDATFFSLSSRKRVSVQREVKSAELITQENKSSVGSKLGWGAAGAVLLGPLGAVAGVLIGGNQTEVCFAAEMQDGKRLVATCSIGAWQSIQGELRKRVPAPVS